MRTAAYVRLLGFQPFQRRGLALKRCSSCAYRRAYLGLVGGQRADRNTSSADSLVNLLQRDLLLVVGPGAAINRRLQSLQLPGLGGACATGLGDLGL